MNHRPCVFIADKFSEDALKLLQQCESIETIYEPGLPESDKKALLQKSQAVIIRSATKITAQLLEGNDTLELIVRAGVGVDNIDVEAATRKGIVVQNVPEGNTRSAAEHAIALLMALARNVAPANQSIKEHLWERSKFLGVEVRGKTLGVVGLGKIGRHVVDMAFGLGFRVQIYDPFVSPQLAEQLNVTLVKDLETLVANVDILTIHVPLSPQTRGLIGDEVLSRARKGLLLINCARGGIVDEDALYRALESGRVGGAALDVFAEEPPSSWALATHPNVVATPHLGASTREAQQNVAMTAAEQVIDFLRERRLHSPVNAIQLDPDLTKDVEPYRQLALKMGRLHAQLLEGQPERVIVKFFGQFFTDRIQSYLTGSVLEGFIGRHSAQPVNFINVRALAKEQGLVVEERSEGSSRYFVNMIRVEVADSGGARELGGTIRGRSGVRLVTLDEYQFDAVLEGEMILAANEDRPGMIAVVGQQLAAAAVNVSYMSLGRDKSGGRALAVLNVDTEVTPAVVEALAEQPGIIWAKAVSVG